MTDEKPAELTDWLRRPWNPQSDGRHLIPTRASPPLPNNVRSSQKEWEDPEGVPIDAILFGGRRANIVPLVTESFDWQHGTFLGATTSSETTAAAAGKVGQLRRDPMAMLPFCGYNMGDYFAHWLNSAKRLARKCRRSIFVNWFRKDERRQVPVAWLRREQPRFEMDLRTLQRHRRCRRIANRTSTAT